MKLSVKMTLCMLALLGVLFALCGYLLVGTSFHSNLNAAIEQGLSLHAQQKVTILRELYAEQTQSVPQDDQLSQTGEKAARLAGNTGAGCAVVTKGYAALYNTLPAPFHKKEQAALIKEQNRYSLRRYAGTTYLAMASPIYTAGKTVFLLSAFDITNLYAMRTLQLGTFWRLYVGMMLIAGAVCAGISAWFTRPIRRLNDVSKAVAAGAYSERVQCDTDDEIGELSHSFNAMAQAIEEKIASLELSVRQREDFMGAFTHELKTPMTAMMGYAALLQTDALAPPVRDKALRYIHSETKRLEALSQKLLMLLGLSDEPVTLVPIAVSALFSCAKNVLNTGPQQRGPIEFWQSEPELYVLADADLLVSLLHNLIENAMHAGGTEESVMVRARRLEDTMQQAENVQEGGSVQIAVTDHGCGIPPEKIARLTEPFYSADKSRSRAQNGSGLGLAICERIARLHGTQLHIESEQGAGTTVSFALRAAQAGGVKAAQPQCAGESPAPQPSIGEAQPSQAESSVMTADPGTHMRLSARTEQEADYAQQ
ncbi:MAG: ATP-binding protein [Ruthenibacterium sp.]